MYLRRRGNPTVKIEEYLVIDSSLVIRKILNVTRKASRKFRVCWVAK